MRKTILLVDDNEINRMALRLMLESDYDILEADDGDTCIHVLEEHFAEVSLVVLDAWMPRMDGFTVLCAFDKRGWLDKVPIIIATSDTTEESEVRLLDLGAEDVIHKPFSAGIVLRKVGNVIKHYEQTHTGDHPKNRKFYSDKSILHCMGSFVYEYRQADGSEDMDSLCTKYLAKEWNSFSIKAPEEIKPFVYRPDFAQLEEFLKKDNHNNFESVDARLMSANGAYEWFRIGKITYPTDNGDITVVIFNNVSAERKAKARLVFLADHDPLTRLLNQQAFSEQIRTLQEQYSDRDFSMLFFSIDRFSVLN